MTSPLITKSSEPIDIPCKNIQSDSPVNSAAVLLSKFCSQRAAQKRASTRQDASQASGGGDRSDSPEFNRSLPASNSDEALLFKMEPCQCCATKDGEAEYSRRFAG